MKQYIKPDCRRAVAVSEMPDAPPCYNDVTRGGGVVGSRRVTDVIPPRVTRVTRGGGVRRGGEGPPLSNRGGRPCCSCNTATPRPWLQHVTRGGVGGETWDMPLTYPICGFKITAKRDTR